MQQVFGLFDVRSDLCRAACHFNRTPKRHQTSLICYASQKYIASFERAAERGNVLPPPYRAIQRTVAAGGCLLLPKYPTLRTVAAARAWICPREGSELVTCPPKHKAACK